jgi:tripartite-type tricarboxylate transporter receptor subunit TctC
MKTKRLDRRRFLQLAAGTAAATTMPRGASAQTYPTRPITIIVPFPAGGPLDTVARLLSERMRTTLGQAIIVENCAGANGTLGVGRAVRAAADGYTLIAGTVTTHVLIGALYALQYDLLNDFKPVALLAQGPLLAVAKPNIPTMDEAGLPGFSVSLWFGLWAPGGTASDMITKLNAAAVDALADPTVRQRLADLGQQVVPRDQQSPEALRAFQKAEIEKWWPIIKDAGLKGE